MLRALTSNDITTQQHLEQKQALAKQFAEILQFTIKFDDAKVVFHLSSVLFILSKLYYAN